MEKINTTQLEQLLTLDTEVICTMEHRERMEAEKNLPTWLIATTVTTTLTTDG